MGHKSQATGRARRVTFTLSLGLDLFNTSSKVLTAGHVIPLIVTIRVERCLYAACPVNERPALYVGTRHITMLACKEGPEDITRIVWETQRAMSMQ